MRGWSTLRVRKKAVLAAVRQLTRSDKATGASIAAKRSEAPMPSRRQRRRRGGRREVRKT